MSALTIRDMASQFIYALAALENERKVDDIAALFADDAELCTTATSQSFHGREGAREFWQAYRRTFGAMRTAFSTVTALDGDIVLEWQTRGETAAGDPIDYRGVSVLEVAEGRIHAFRAYFDPSALTQRGRAEQDRAEPTTATDRTTYGAGGD